MTGTSFTSYLNGRRLTYAAELLYKTDEKFHSLPKRKKTTIFSNKHKKGLLGFSNVCDEQALSEFG